MRSGTACAVTNRIWNVITDPVPALFPTLQRIIHTGMEVVLPPTGEGVSCGAALTRSVTAFHRASYDVPGERGIKPNQCQYVLNGSALRCLGTLPCSRRGHEREEAIDQIAARSL